MLTGSFRVTCAVCPVRFTMSPSRYRRDIKRSGSICCSKQCADEYKHQRKMEALKGMPSRTQ